MDGYMNLRFSVMPRFVFFMAQTFATAVCVLPLDSRANKPTDEAALKPALTVTTTQVMQTALPMTLAASGSIAAWQEVIVGSESNGLRLTAVRAEVGDGVRTGQVLALFDDVTVKNDVAQARAALQEAAAYAAEAVANAERARSLQQTQALSAQQMTQYLTAEKTAQAKEAAAKAALNAQTLRLQKTQVRAPDSGTISARTAVIGAVAGSGAELFRLIRKSRLEWRAEVTAAELGRLKAGMPVTLKVTNDVSINGKIRTIAPTIDPQTRIGLVYVDLLPQDSRQAAVKAGMFAKGVFSLGHSVAPVLPQQALVIRDGFTYVFKLNSNNHVSRVKVQTGRRFNDQIEIISGLAAGTTVVMTGAGFLNEGDLVRVVKASPLKS